MTWAPRALLLVALALLGAVVGVVATRALETQPPERIRPVDLQAPPTTAPTGPGVPEGTTTTTTTTAAVAPPVPSPTVTVLPLPTVPLDDDDDDDDDDDADDDADDDDG